MIKNLKNFNGFYVDICIESDNKHLWENLKSGYCKTGIINSVNLCGDISTVHMSMDLPNEEFSHAIIAATRKLLELFFEEFSNVLPAKGKATINIKDDNNDEFNLPWLEIESYTTFDEVLKNFTCQLQSDDFIYKF